MLRPIAAGISFAIAVAGGELNAILPKGRRLDRQSVADVEPDVSFEPDELADFDFGEIG